MNNQHRLGSRNHIIVIISTLIIVSFSVIMTMMNNQVIGWDHSPITAPTSTTPTSNISYSSSEVMIYPTLYIFLFILYISYSNLSYSSSEVMIQNNRCDDKSNFRPLHEDISYLCHSSRRFSYSPDSAVDDSFRPSLSSTLPFPRFNQSLT